MARVRLIIENHANRITLKTILETDGHRVVDEAPEVVVVDTPAHAAAFIETVPTLILATASDIRNAVAAMKKGAYGYLFVPFQPGEASLMVSRAAASNASAVPTATAPDSITLEEAETEQILATIRRCRGNKAEAARVLGIGRNTLWRKLKLIQERSDTRQGNA